MKIHFVGIGGIGISALARLAKHSGHKVCGSDMKASALTKELEEEGIAITTPHSKEAIKEQDLIIHSAAIKGINEEIVEAKRLGIKIYHRKESLPFLLKDRKVFSVCGAHGKSTTTAILASILKSNAIIGAESKEFGSNVHFTDDDRVVFEADESDGSFVNSNPYCAVVTNAEPEHMEHYNYDIELFHKHYRAFLDEAKIRVINVEDDFLKSYTKEAIRLDPKKDIKDITLEIVDHEPYTSFNLGEYGRFKVWGFGNHIALDASLAILAALEEIDVVSIREHLKGYRGIKKRFDIVKKDKNRIVIDDYGHHPTEIKATLGSAKKFASLNGLDKITVIWQPHKYSRTVDNLEGFIGCFEGVDKLYILPVWSAGEEAVDIDFEEKFKRYAPVMIDSIDEVKNELEKGLIIGFGAGDITYQLREI